MKDNIFKILKIALLAAVAILAILLVFGLVLALNWPWWVGIFLLFVLAGIGVGIFLIRRIMMRRREQLFVQDVIAQDEARIKMLNDKEKDEMKALQGRWKEAIEALRTSHLKQRGNPLYVLPWYLILGESGSGKTTAISSARLSSPFAEVKRTSGISGTKNCDWWFFEQAIIIDTAGRYAIPVDEGRDKEEWQGFMGLLAKFRKKEPLNGLVVTIPADKLLEGTPESLEDDGRNIRRRIDELMRVLGAKFPVYVMVTKCDLVQGMSRFAEHLPEKSLDQPMGFLNQSLSKDVPSFIDNAINTIGERLRTLRMLMLHHAASGTVDPALLLFPEEFEQMRPGIETFMKSAFQENPYQETPILRGLFFSSGRQEGTPYSHFLNALGLIGEKEVLPGTSRGLFLHEFFARIMPADRQLFAPTKRAIEWQVLTRNLGLTAWILLVVALCGILSFSYVKNLRTIRVATRELAKPTVLRGEFLSDLVSMDHFRETILLVEARNKNWWIPRFRLNESLEVEMGLKKRYCKQFDEGFLSAFDKRMAVDMAKLIGHSPATDEIIGQYIVHLVRRINLLKGRLEGMGFNELRDKPQPSYVSILSVDRGMGPEVKRRFGYLHLYYLIWRDDTGNINKEVTILQAWLRDLIAARGGNLRWLVAWVNVEGNVPSVTLGEFWGGSLNVADEKPVGAAFTRKGKEIVDGILKETEMALPDPIFLESRKAGFMGWYHNTYLESWQNFGAMFPKGTLRLKGMKEWRQVASRTTADQGPYGLFLNRAALELEPMATGEIAPQWLKHIYQFQLAKVFKDQQGTVAKAAEGAKKVVSNIEKMVGREVGGEELEAQRSAGKAYQEFTAALTGISPAASSRAQAYQMTLQAFNEETGTGKSPFYAGYNAVNRLKTNLARGKPVDDMTAKLISGPMDFLWTFVRAETACYIQRQWEEKVLAEAQGVTGQQAVQMLLAPEGPVWKFVKGSGIAAPFIGWNVKQGYYAKEVLNGAIAFEPGFFSFLSKGGRVVQVAAQTRQGNNVSIRGFPTSVNPEVSIKPHSTKLELLCASGIQSLANYNYPVGRNFVWSPDNCTDVVFQIEVSDIVLTKKYSGPNAFPDFLRDFPGGRRTFYPNEFPTQRSALNSLGIKYIKVQYQFSGEGQIRQIAAMPGQAPRNITRCWGE